MAYDGFALGCQPDREIEEGDDGDGDGSRDDEAGENSTSDDWRWCALSWLNGEGQQQAGELGETDNK